MNRTNVIAWALAALLAAGPVLGDGTEHGAPATSATERPASGWMERSFTRLGRAIERLGARMAGKGGANMEGCADMMGGGGMMSGGGMMGGNRPNERWLEPAEIRGTRAR